MLDMTVLAIVFGAIVLAALVLSAGFVITRMLPTALVQVGDNVEIFTDGTYNRTAAITGVTGDRLYIYGTLPLPLDYRGRFYAAGTDIDGVEFWYLANRKHYFLVPFAERVRKAYRQLSYPYNLCPVTSETELLAVARMQKKESEKFQEETEEVTQCESEKDPEE